MTAGSTSPAHPDQSTSFRSDPVSPVVIAEQILASAEDGIIAYDRQIRYLFWNRFMEDLTGKPAAEVLGKGPVEVFPFLAEQGVPKMLERALAGESFTGPDVEQVHCRTGRAVWITPRLGPIRLVDGTIIGVLVILRDITERRLAELALRRSEERYRTLAEASHDMIVIIGRDGMVEYANSFAARQFNREPQDLIGKPRQALFSGEVDSRQAENLQQVFQTGEPLYVESPTTFPGRELWLGSWLVPIRDPAGQITSVLVTSRDITQQKTAETELERRSRLMKIALSAAGMGVWRWDLETHAISTREGKGPISGLPAEMYPADLDGFFNLVHPEDRARVKERLEKTVLGGLEYDVEFRFLHPAGQTRWVYARGQLQQDAQRRPIAVTGVDLDVTDRRRTEEALRESEAKYRKLIEAANDAIIVADAETGCILDVNRRAEELVGYPAADLVGQPHTKLHPPAEADRYRRVFQEHLLKGGAISEDLFVQHRDGHLIAVDISAGVIELQGRRLVQGIFRDSSERKRSEERLRLLSAALQSAANGIVITDRQGAVVWGNAAFTRLTGFDISEALGNTLRFLNSGNHEPAFFQEMWRTILAGEVWSGEVINRHKDGSLYTEEQTITPVRGPNGDITHFIAIKQDVTERKRMELALRQSHRQFQLIFQSSPVAIDISTLRDGRYVDVNESFLEMVGFDRGEVVGHTATELGLWADPAQRDELVKRLQEHGSAQNFEARFRDKSGRVHDVLISVELILLGLEPCQVFINIDITERKRLEAQLRQAQKMESIGTLAGGVAHDFNNLLTIIQGHSQMALQQSGNPEASESLRQITAATDRAANLTRQLLAFSRQQPIQLRRADLNEVVANITKMLRRLIGEDITLECRYSPHLPLVHVDVGLVEQVLLNLAVNARDAMPEGGRLIIKTESIRLRAQDLRSSPSAREGVFVCLAVQDNGSGIPREVLPRIFDPFFTTKEVGKGTGLGLATVHGIVQQHQGWIEVDTEVGKGTTFRIFLPGLADTQRADAAEASAAPAPGGKETILLVEDDPALRSLARQVLERYGYQLLEAESGAAALRLWASHPGHIDLLLTDMVMPGGVNGQQLADRLRRDRPELKVLLTSGYNALVSTDRPGGYQYLQKPYAPPVLAQAVRACLDTHPNHYAT